MVQNKLRLKGNWLRFGFYSIFAFALILSSVDSAQARITFLSDRATQPKIAIANAPAATLRVTVGTNPNENACGASDEITVSQGAIVYFCYTVTNTGDTTFNFHNVSDDIHGSLLVDFDYTLRPGEAVSLTHEMYVANAPVINNTTWVASVTKDGVEFPALASGSAVVQVQGAPTIVQLSGFNTERTAGGMLIKWSTVREDDTQGFHVYRVDGKSNAPIIPGNAKRVNTQLIASKGPNGGSYELLDNTAVAGKIYTYWLREIEIGGIENDYSMSGARPNRVFLPMVLRLAR